jgi:nitrate reductase gamma subunit
MRWLGSGGIEATEVRAVRRETAKAAGWGMLATGILAALIVIGSRDLAHFDAALVGYTFATLFATFGITYRYAMWLQRPPTAVYWRRGWQVFFRRGHRLRNVGLRWPKHVGGDILLNAFIWRRGSLRWLTHWLIMWGCVIAAAITFPLVFGWLHFVPLDADPEWYRVVVFGFPTMTFPVDSLVAFLVFHGLVWSAFLVIAGVMLAMRRRMRDEGAQAVQLFAEDFLPLILLFAISITGLMLTASYTWMEGYGYPFLATLHALTVIFTLVYLPFGKFFHIFQRPAQIGVRFYKDVGASDEGAACRRCGHPFTSALKVRDLITTERALGFRYEIPDAAAEHYQWICPPCRRTLLAQSQQRLGAAPDGPGAHTPMPVYVNPGLGEGPLGREDAQNFHP